MRYLLIEQHSEQRGLIKSWRLRPQHGIHTFGSSKNAKLRSPLVDIKGFQGYFEYKNGDWWYASLDPDHNFKNNNTQSSDARIDEVFEFIVYGSLVRVKSIQVREDLHKKIQHAEYKPDSSHNKKYHFVLIKEADHLHTTKMIPLGEKLHHHMGHEKMKIALKDSQDWVIENYNSVQIQYKTVYSENELVFKKFSFRELYNKDLAVTYKVIGGFLMTLLIAFALAPKEQKEEIMDMKQQFTYVPQKPVKKKKEEPAKEKATAAAAAAPVYDGGGSSNKITQKLQISKLSALIGKVSSQSAKTKNIIVTQGVKAGTAPSGRALANLGKITQNGVDWGTVKGPQGVNIGTVGSGGGRGVASLGTLSGGNVGKGNVGLIEDESEISGGLDKEIIAQYIKTQLGQILYCYERQLSADAKLSGKVAVKFTIGPQGEVEGQKIGETSLNNSTVESCILQKVAKWKFPTPKGGTRVVVTYPFLFKSTN